MPVTFDNAIHTYEFTATPEEILNAHGYRSTSSGDIEFRPVCGQCQHYNGSSCALLQRVLEENTPACTGFGFESAVPF